MFHNELTRTLHIKYPIIQAPMAGGVTTSELVAEVSNCGGLGMIGAGYLTPLQMRKQIQEVKQLTSKPFGINLFVPNEFLVNQTTIQSSYQFLAPIRQQLNMPQAESFEIPCFNEIVQTFTEQIKIVIEEQIPICSFTFGIPSKEVIRELKLANIILMGTATTVKEAIENEKAGMDFIVVQGSEAGGHRGSFIDAKQEGLVGLMSLIPQVVDHVTIPVIAAGGIMDARGLMASICLGAKGVQMGTAFLTCIESGASTAHIQAILNACEDQVVLTRSFSGKWARGVKNKYIKQMEEYETHLPEFPIQNALTQDIRKAASTQGNSEYMSLWCGQTPALAKIQSVEALIKGIIEEVKKFNAMEIT